MSKISVKKGLLALSPLAVFLALYLLLSLLLGDFNAMPITVAFLISSVFSITLLKGKTLDERVDIFSHGASDSNFLLMLWIFILSGAFTACAKEIGSIQATVDLCLHILPPQLILASIFFASCFVSMSLGTSVGTIVAITPITTGIAQETGASLPIMVAAVVGGAFFGDNLSFISDTTIVATRTQGCRMRDKFRTNVRVALPAAAIVLAIYIFMGMKTTGCRMEGTIDWLLVAPYILVLATALCGMNVMSVLTLGIASTGAIALMRNSCGIFQWLGSMGDGILSMGELIIITLLSAGMVGVIRYLGGIDFLLQRLTKNISTRRRAELTIAALTTLTDMCTANNTIALITVGPLAKDISTKYNIDPRRSASIIDTFSCFIQGILPYGNQILIGCAMAGVNTFDIIPYLFYPLLLGVFALLSILRSK